MKLILIFWAFYPAIHQKLHFEGVLKLPFERVLMLFYVISLLLAYSKLSSTSDSGLTSFVTDMY